MTDVNAATAKKTAETKPAGETPDTGKPADGEAGKTAETPEVSDLVTLRGTVELNGNGQVQTGYNLAVVKAHEPSISALTLLAGHPICAGLVDVENSKGQVFVSLKANAKSKTAIKRAGSMTVLLDVVVRITGARARQFRGEIVEVIAVKPAGILSGGRIVEVDEDAREARAAERSAATTGGGARRGGLGNFRL